MKSVLLMFAAVALLAAQDAPTGSISGVVLDSVTHTPVKGAVVMTWSNFAPHLRRLSGTGLAQERRMQTTRQITARTDASGSFTLHDLPPGTYPLNITHNRYQQFRGPTMKSVELRAGETATVTVELTPGATLSGHVVDEDGDPLAGCIPQLLPARPGEPVGVMGSSPSDSTGLFTMWGVSPGKFKLMLRCSSTVLESYPMHPITDPPPPPTLAYPTVFYPGVTDSNQAQLIELSPGMDKAGVDLQIKPAHVFTVGGTVRAAGADLSKVTLTLIPRDQVERESIAALDVVKGTFSVRNVFAGSYRLLAFVRDENAPRYGIRIPIDVPVPGPIDVELKPAVDLNGKVEVEGEFKLPLSSIGVELIETEPVGLGVNPSRTGEDGTFTIRGVLPGVYRVEAYGPNVFVKSVSWGGQDLTDSLLDMSGGAAGPLRVLVSSNTATIKGTGPANRPVEIIPVTSPNGTRTNTMTDAQGLFTLPGLRPGKYRVVVGGGALATDETTGAEVTVAEGETATVTIQDPGDR